MATARTSPPSTPAGSDIRERLQLPQDITRLKLLRALAANRRRANRLTYCPSAIQSESPQRSLDRQSPPEPDRQPRLQRLPSHQRRATERPHAVSILSTAQAKLFHPP